MRDLYKYPRSLHLPHSPGATDDDKVMKDYTCFEGKEQVYTEKMDGECSTLYNFHSHARSLDSAHHPSRDWLKGLWGNIKHEIPDGWRICGENLYARHSIEYASLESYFLVFSIWNEKNICFSWKETEELSAIFGLKTVPVLHVGPFDLEFMKNFHNRLDLSKQEGFVVRNSNGFHYDDFGENLAKWVRPSHVQTDEHWMFNKITPNGLKDGNKNFEGRTGIDTEENLASS